MGNSQQLTDRVGLLDDGRWTVASRLAVSVEMTPEYPLHTNKITTNTFHNTLT